MSDELHLKVFIDRSELVRADGTTEIFFEGPANNAAKLRYKRIAQALEAGFLNDQILLCRDHPEALELDRLRVCTEMRTHGDESPF